MCSESLLVLSDWFSVGAIADDQLARARVRCVDPGICSALCWGFCYFPCFEGVWKLKLWKPLEQDVETLSTRNHVKECSQNPEKQHWKYSGSGDLRDEKSINIINRDTNRITKDGQLSIRRQTDTITDRQINTQVSSTRTIKSQRGWVAHMDT